MHYLDANATHPLSGDAKRAVIKGIEMNNISSSQCKEAKDKMNRLSKITKDSISMYPDTAGSSSFKTVWTSGASESNATIIWHVIHSIKDRKPVFVTAKSSHSSVSNFLDQLQKEGVIDVLWVETDIQGYVIVDEFINHFNVGIVDCCMIQSVCSETGAIQPVGTVGLHYKSTQPNGVYAIDHTQGFMKVLIDTKNADFISISYHKVGGSIGCGALLNRNRFNQLIGGKQNGGLRGGTINMGGIYSALVSIPKLDYGKCRRLGNKLIEEFSKKFNVFDSTQFGFRQLNQPITFVHVKPKNGYADHIVFGSFFFNSKPVCGVFLKNELLKRGFLIGTGSACSTGEKSHLGSVRSSSVMGDILPIGFVRFSFCQNTSSSSITELINEIVSISNMF